jgi:hypothetical protein
MDAKSMGVSKMRSAHPDHQARGRQRINGNRAGRRTGWHFGANFRPTGDCLLWGVMYIITDVLHKCFGLLYSMVKFAHTYIWTKTSWATFWLIFSQTNWSPWRPRKISVKVETYKLQLKLTSYSWNLQVTVETYKLQLKLTSYSWNLQVTVEIYKLQLKFTSYSWNLQVTVETYKCNLQVSDWSLHRNPAFLQRSVSGKHSIPLLQYQQATLQTS